jgi:hypothetical protein
LAVKQPIQAWFRMMQVAIHRLKICWIQIHHLTAIDPRLQALIPHLHPDPIPPLVLKLVLRTVGVQG